MGYILVQKYTYLDDVRNKTSEKYRRKQPLRAVIHFDKSGWMDKIGGSVSATLEKDL